MGHRDVLAQAPNMYTCNPAIDLNLARALSLLFAPFQKPGIELLRPVNTAVPQRTLSSGTEDAAVRIRPRGWRVTYS